FQEAIFGDQIFIPRQQLLVRHPRDEGQDARPIHSSSTPADSRLIAPKIVASAAQRGYAENDNSPSFQQLEFFDHTGNVLLASSGFVVLIDRTNYRRLCSSSVDHT